MRRPSSNYRLVPKKGEESRENEIRVKAHTRPFVYAAYAGKLLIEKKHDHIYMIATGSATARAIQSVEYVRRRVAGLMVCYEIESTEFLDEYEPLVEGLERVQVRRMVPTLKAHLFLKENAELQGKPGFMAAVASEELADEERFKLDIAEHFSKERPERYNEERGRPRGRGGYRGDRQQGEYRGGRQQGGYGGDRQQGEYRGGRQQGGYGGDRQRGEYRGDRQQNDQAGSEYRGQRGQDERGQRGPEDREQRGGQMQGQGRGGERNNGGDANRVEERRQQDAAQEMRKYHEGEQRERNRHPRRNNTHEYPQGGYARNNNANQGYRHQARGAAPHGEQRNPNYFRGA